MDTSFATSPNKEAVALIHGLRPVASSVFYGLLPELRARAFTVSGVEGANVLQRVRDAIAALPQGIGPDGKDYTWDTQAKEIAAELEPFLGEEGAARRAEILLRTSGFQAFSSTIWNISQADDDTTHLQYIHGDQAKDPTPSHIALDGIVLPKDDPFWETHTGPWGHLGCVCYVRPMNEDLVAEEQSKDDQQANPEARNVLDGETLNQLHNGTLMRAGRRHDVSPPEGERAFKWHPDDLRIPLNSLKPRYDPPVWDAFHLWSMKTMVGEGTTVWQWLEGKDPTPTPAQRQRIARATKHILDHKLTTISPIRPISPISPIKEFSTWQSATTWADDAIHPNSLGLGHQELEAVKDYQATSTNLNKALWGHEHELSPERVTQWTRDMDVAFNKAPTLPHMVVHHFAESANWESVPVGQSVTMRGFMSTTMVAEGRANEVYNQGAHLKIIVPAGAKGIYLDKLVSEFHAEEAEIVFNRGTKLVVLSKHLVNGVWEMTAELRP